MFGLAPRGRLPFKPEPGAVFLDRCFELIPRAARIDILDAQQETPAALAREIEIEERRIGVAEVQMTIGRRREAEDALAIRCHSRRHCEERSDDAIQPPTNAWIASLRSQ